MPPACCCIPSYALSYGLGYKGSIFRFFQQEMKSCDAYKIRTIYNFYWMFIRYLVIRITGASTVQHLSRFVKIGSNFVQSSTFGKCMLSYYCPLFYCTNLPVVYCPVSTAFLPPHPSSPLPRIVSADLCDFRLPHAVLTTWDNEKMRQHDFSKYLLLRNMKLCFTNILYT